MFFLQLTIVLLLISMWYWYRTSVVWYQRYLDTYHIIDTYVTIPVSLRSRYIVVYRSSKKYRDTAQVSWVSTIPYSFYHWATGSLLAYDAKTNVIKSRTVKHCASSSHSVTKYYYTGHLWVVLLSRKDWLCEDKEQDSNFKDFCELEM